MAQSRTTVSFKSAEQAEHLTQVLKSAKISGPSKLLQAIADQTIAPITWSAEVQSALMAAAVALQAQSDARADTLLDMLSQLPLTPPNQAEVGRLRQRDAGWVAQAKELIAQHQPFTLHYRDKDWLVQYAELAYNDGREYLHTWIAEGDKKAEVPELANNRLFLLSEEASVTSRSDTIWRTEGLDSIEVSFNVGFRYRTKPEDQVVAVESIQIGQESWAKVTQRVTNLLWFLQRIARYGDRAVIEASKTIRDLYVQQLRQALSLYD